jgi:hypothetical protein
LLTLSNAITVPSLDRNFVKTLIVGIEDGFSAINEEADSFNCHLLD